MPDHNEVVQSEFDRTARLFAQRTKGRFDDLDVVSFSRVSAGATVIEVGTGTASFLSLFQKRAGMLVGMDLTQAMLKVAHESSPDMKLVRGDAFRLPFRSGSVDLIASAQMFHHIHEPLPILKEMRRVASRDGHVLVVDQVGTEHFEALEAMNALERIRDPSHARSRPPSAFRIVMNAAGLEIVDERVAESSQRLSAWMWPDEFPPERIEAVRAFIDEQGSETGMGFRPEGDDYSFTRRRIMVLARVV